MTSNDSFFQNKLLTQARQGDMESFEELIKQYEKLIFNITYRMLGNAEDAKDMAQEALIKIYRNIGNCVDIKHFRSWIYTVTNNVCIDELRKRKGKYTESIDEQLELDEGSVKKQIESNDLTPEESLLKTELSENIQRAIDKLPADKKQLIILRDIYGLRYDELSDITKTSLGTVKSRLARARVSLKIILIKLKEQNIL